MSFLLLLVCFYLITFSICSQYTESDTPVDLGKDNLTQIVESEDFVFVDFYTPSCGACKKVAPHWQKLPKALHESGIKNVVIGQVKQFLEYKVDIALQEELQERYHISSTPTFLLFEKDVSDPSQYMGARHLEAFEYFLKKKLNFTELGSPAHVLNDNLSDMFTYIFWRGNPHSSMETTFVGFFPNKATNEYKVFIESILSFIDFIRVAEASTANAETFKLPKDKPSLVLYRDFDEGKSVYSGDWSKESIVDFVKSNSIPMITKVDHEDLKQKLFSVGDGFLVHLFVTEAIYEEDFVEIKDKLLDDIVYERVENGVLKRGNFTIALTNGEKYKSWLALYKLEEKDIPSIVAYFPRTQKKYVYGSLLNKGSWNELGVFLDSLYNNELKPLPEKEEDPADILINAANPMKDEL